MGCSDLTYKLLVLSKIKGLGNKGLLGLALTEGFAKLSFQELAERNKVLNKNMDVLHLAEAAADKEVKDAGSINSKIVSIFDLEYPELMRKTNESPVIIYIKGHWHTDSNKAIGIIGTREPTKHGTVIANRISEYFSAEDYSIVSGLAVGCDTLAHESALRANAHTVAVLSHGLQMIAPRQNTGLAKRILDSGGLLLTEYSYGTEVKPFQYVQRDKIQAALAQAIIMIQSGLKGGSLHASRAILKYGRILATPYPTEEDIKNNYPRVEANLVISGDDETAIRKLLSCEDIGKIVSLKSKNDYQGLVELFGK